MGGAFQSNLCHPRRRVPPAARHFVNLLKHNRVVIIGKTCGRGYGDDGTGKSQPFHGEQVSRELVNSNAGATRGVTASPWLAVALAKAAAVTFKIDGGLSRRSLD